MQIRRIYYDYKSATKDCNQLNHCLELLLHFYQLKEKKVTQESLSIFTFMNCITDLYQNYRFFEATGEMKSYSEIKEILEPYRTEISDPLYDHIGFNLFDKDTTLNTQSTYEYKPLNKNELCIILGGLYAYETFSMRGTNTDDKNELEKIFNAYRNKGEFMTVTEFIKNKKAEIGTIYPDGFQKTWPCLSKVIDEEIKEQDIYIQSLLLKEDEKKRKMKLARQIAYFFYFLKDTGTSKNSIAKLTREITGYPQRSIEKFLESMEYVGADEDKREIRRIFGELFPIICDSIDVNLEEEKTKKNV